ncbi:MAG TPA: alpha/beta fold hydrolase, partial [Casimicrobiaceae bacterium]|nr:alpha/beta fold hydrolase [Casimicrobiaceae bacterium]
MLPPEPDLEVRSRRPARANSRPPLLFVHGGYCDGWCWEPHFLPWFAARGYAAYALSLRGHGKSGGHETLFVAGLDDYAADVAQVARSLPAPPILVGHSMGAAIVEHLIVSEPVRGAAL